MSGSLDALLVESTDVEAVCAHFADDFDADEIRERAREAPGAAWIALDVSAAVGTGARDLSDDSRAFGEALSIRLTAFGDDVFLYDHFRDGALIRRLEFDPRQGWLVVEGTPQPWEASILAPRVGSRAGMASTERILDAITGALRLPPLSPR